MHVDDSQRQAFEDGQTSPAKSTAAAQQFTDNLIGKTWLRLFPYSVRPNHLTILRFILTPVVLVLLYLEYRGWAFGVFVLAVCTDFLDGAMARTRDQITKLGMIIDPLADKLLIGAVLAWIGYENNWQFAGIDFLNVAVPIILAFIVLEIVLLAIGIGTARPGDRVRPANVFGKSKMVVQSLAVILFLIGGIFNLEDLLTVSLYMLWVAIVFALLSGSRHIRERFAKPKPPATT